MMVGRNLVHGSDSPENGETEIALWFDPADIVTYERGLDAWILE